MMNDQHPFVRGQDVRVVADGYPVTGRVGVVHTLDRIGYVDVRFPGAGCYVLPVNAVEKVDEFLISKSNLSKARDWTRQRGSNLNWSPPTVLSKGTPHIEVLVDVPDRRWMLATPGDKLVYSRGKISIEFEPDHIQVNTGEGLRVQHSSEPHQPTGEWAHPGAPDLISDPVEHQFYEPPPIWLRRGGQRVERVFGATAYNVETGEQIELRVHPDAAEMIKDLSSYQYGTKINHYFTPDKSGIQPRVCLLCRYLPEAHPEEPSTLGHTFEPYAYDPTRCGYVDGDDQMCGYSEVAHR